jgi:PAS domain S-box-containing protein
MLWSRLDGDQPECIRHSECLVPAMSANNTFREVDPTTDDGAGANSRALGRGVRDANQNFERAPLICDRIRQARYSSRLGLWQSAGLHIAEHRSKGTLATAQRSCVISINFEALFGASPNPYVLLDPTFTIITMNDAYLQATMREREELVGRDMFEAFPSDPNSVSYRQLRTSLERVVSEGVRDHLPLIQYDIPLPNGQGFEERYWSATHTPLFNQAGELSFILQHTVDVTELHRLRGLAKTSVLRSGGSTLIETDVFRRAQAVQEANEALKEERKHLRGLFEQAPGFMAALSGPQHVFEMANAAYHQLVGHRSVIGKPVREALPEVVGQGFMELLDRVRETGQPFVGRGIRVRLQQRPGAVPEERYVDFVYQPILAADGTTSGIFVQGHDVTDQKRAENALRESEERFRLVAESAPVMLWMGDREGKCLYLNRTQREFWGVAPDAIAQFDWSTTVHPEDREILFGPFSKGMQTQTAFSVEARFRQANGQYRLVQTNAQPRFGPGGEFLGMIGVNVDITEARRAEMALRTETRTLEVLNRTGAAIAAELDLDRVVQTVTDAGVALTGAQFGAFFYNVLDDQGESFMVYALSGVPREAFSKFPMPRATAVFRPTFHGEGIIRSDDILADPRYGRNEPFRGMPEGHLPVRSYLAVPVTSRSGEVLGGLFFGHAEPGRFKQEHETLLVGIAGQAATAIDNSRLYQAAQRELDERRRIEEALRESERRFRTIADTMPQIVWSTRADGYHDYYNSRWYEFTGLSPEESEGAAWNPTLHPDDRERAWTAWRRSLETGAPYEIEYRFRATDGTYRWFIGRALPIRNQKGEIERWFGTCTDIHDLKRAQDALRESQERAIAAEAETRRLAEALADRVGELDAANDEIQRFAYIVSHDLRAPLVNILGFTSELEGAKDQLDRFYRAVAERNPELVTPETRIAIETDLAEAIGFIRSSSSKMDRLIAAILKLSREGRRVLAPERIDMGQLLEGQRQSIAHQLNERDAKLIIKDVPDLTSDRLAVEQIFGNLIENAVKYLLADRPGRIAVSGRDIGAYIRYEVADNGRGIDPKDFERIFDLFRRSGVQDLPGEGIGLAHVRALVRRLGGTISVSSQLGEGSVFTVTLPKTLIASLEAA